MEFVNIDCLVGAEKLNADAGAVDRLSSDVRACKDGMYAKMALLPPVLIDFEFNVLGRVEAIAVARELSLPVVPCRRQQVDRESSDFPLRFQLEITSACDSKCIMCPRHSKAFTRGSRHLDPELFYKAIDEISQFENYQLQLCHIGESLLHPKVFELLDYMKQYPQLGAKWMSSKGQNLTDDVIRKTLLSGIDFFNLSLLAMTSETYAKVSPGGDFETVRANLLRVAELKREMGLKKPVVRVQMIEMQETYAELDAFLEQWHDKADMLSVNKLETFGDRLKDGYTFNGKVAALPERTTCNRLKRGDLYLLSNGEVTICDTDFDGKLSLGNLRDMTFKEMRDGKKYRQLLLLHDEKRFDEIELCANCQDWNL